MPFVYQTAPNSLVPSIAELMLRPGQIEAQKATAIADAQSRAAIASGDAWSRAFSGVGNAAASTVTAMTDPTRQLQTMKLADAQRQQAGQKAVAGLMTPQPQSGPTEDGQPMPPSNPYLKQEGDVSVWDVEGLSKALAAQGFGDLTPQVMKDIGDLNKAHRDEASARSQFAQAQTNVIAKGAGTALSVLRDHPEADPRAVVKLVGQQMAANGTFTPDKLQATMADLLSDPTQLQAKLSTLSRLGSQAPVALKDKEKLLNPSDLSGPPLAENDAPELEKATFGVPQPDGSVLNVEGMVNKKSGEYTYQGKVVANPVKPAEQRPFSLDEQLYTAIAKGDDATKDRILSTMQAGANAKRDPVATAQLEAIRNMTAAEAQARLDDRDVGSQKNQQKFEQEYRTVLQRTLSSRSGGLGMEDQKVNQAIHLLTLFDQNKDPKTGEYTIPKMMQAEVALGLARLISPTGVPSEGIVNELNQKTLKGDLAGAVTYLTGQPVTGNTQAMFQLLRDSIERQGKVAESNRQTYLDSIKSFAPTDLNEDRRAQVERGLNLNTVTPRPKEGTTRAVDGQTLTWKTVNGQTGWYR